MDQGVPVGTSRLPTGSTNLWKKCAISRRRCPTTGGGATWPYVEKGVNRGIATRPRWETKTVILSTQEGGRLARLFQVVILLVVDQGGEDVEDDKFYSLYFV